MISIILPNLAGGGAERVGINLAQAWRESGQDVELVLMERRGELLRSAETEIRIFCLETKRIRQVPVSLSLYLRRRRPNVILANMWPLTSAAYFAWLMAGKPGRLFLCEHVGLTDHVKHETYLPLWFARAVLRVSHRRASGLVSVSVGAAKDLFCLIGSSDCKVNVIYNPVVSQPLPDVSRPPDLALRRQLWRGSYRTHLLSVGSLKPSKNHRLLLRAFAKIFVELDASLVILGEGSLRSLLEEDIKNLKLQDRVVMPGFTSNPNPWFGSADLFALSSDFEGFANVIPEALWFGTPVVSCDCPYGPAEILEKGLFGELTPVGDVDGLATGILRALARAWDRRALQRRALDFSISTQARAYLNLFNCK